MKALKKTLLACLGGASLAIAAVPAQAQTEIVVWSDTPRLPIFEAYDEAHPDVVFKTLTVSDDELVTKLQLAMQANAEVPDVIFMASTPHPALLSTRRSNYLMDLKPDLSQDVLDGFFTNANSICSIDGKILCLRSDVAHLVNWYDASLVEELGITVPETWEEFEQLGADLAARGEGHILGSGTQPELVMGFLYGSGCDLAVPVADAENTLKVDLSTDECLRAANMVDNMLANGSLSKFGAFEPGMVAEAADNKLVMMMGPTWYGEFVMKPSYGIPAGRLAVAAPPRWSAQDEPLTFSWGGGNYGGWRGTEHPDIVRDIIIWTATEETHLENAVTMPADSSASVIWGQRVNADPYYATNDVFDQMLDAAQYSHPGYASLRFDIRVAWAKTVGPQLAEGQKLADLLPAFAEEVSNMARVAGYEIE